MRYVSHKYIPVRTLVSGDYVDLELVNVEHDGINYTMDEDALYNLHDIINDAIECDDNGEDFVVYFYAGGCKIIHEPLCPSTVRREGYVAKLSWGELMTFMAELESR